MFTNRLPSSNNLFGFIYTPYAKKHCLNKFIKKYPGKWELTDESIQNDLIRLRVPTNTTQDKNQIDQLYYKDNMWIAKYDFAIAGTRISPKASGNRCIIFIDNIKESIQVLLIYNKKDLPKNKKETEYIKEKIKTEFPDIFRKMN